MQMKTIKQYKTFLIRKIFEWYCYWGFKIITVIKIVSQSYYTKYLKSSVKICSIAKIKYIVLSVGQREYNRNICTHHCLL